MASALLLLISSISCLPEREQLTEVDQSDLRLADIVVPAGFVMTTTRLVQVSMEGAIAEYKLSLDNDIRYMDGTRTRKPLRYAQLRAADCARSCSVPQPGSSYQRAG